jgi:hypothetical protein
MDVQWWDKHIEEVREHFRGAKLSSSNMAKRHGTTYVGKVTPDWTPFGNSGAGCVAFAAALGAKRIILLGYDCQKTHGLTHWHGSHPRGLGDAGSMPKWPAQFKRLADRWGAHAEIINCSRQTALTVFPRGDLEDQLTKPAA